VREFALEALPVRTLPRVSPPVPKVPGEWDGMVAPPPAPVTRPTAPRPAAERAGERPARGETPSEAGAREPEEPRIPKFLETTPREPRSWTWLWLVLSVLGGTTLGAAAFQTRQAWWPRLAALHVLPGLSSSSSSAALGLNLLDNHGQLQIRWNAGSPALANAGGGVVDIVDGSALPHTITLDRMHLQSGSFTYARESGKVDVVLTVSRPGAEDLREASSFWGKPPAGESADAGDSDLRKERDDLAVAATRLEADLKAETERNRKLERALADARAQLKAQQRKRLEKQNPGR
jgi:hypothetical protein